jgi:hypothetical protein
VLHIWHTVHQLRLSSCCYHPAWLPYPDTPATSPSPVHLSVQFALYDSWKRNNMTILLNERKRNNMTILLNEHFMTKLPTIFLNGTLFSNAVF